MAFVKLNRNLVRSNIYHNDKLLSFYVRLIMLCKVKPQNVNNVEVPRGAILITIRDLAAVLNLKITNTFDKLKSLEREQLISISKCPQGSIITINNFDCIGGITEKSEQENFCSGEQKPNKIEGSTLLYNNKKNVKNGVSDARKQKSEIENSNEDGDPEEIEESKIRELHIPTRESLVEKYGEENVFEYECRFERWRSRQKKPVEITCYEAIERWMRDDNVQKPRQLSSEAGYDTDEIMRRIISSYNDKEVKK